MLIIINSVANLSSDASLPSNSNFLIWRHLIWSYTKILERSFETHFEILSDKFSAEEKKNMCNWVW